MFILIILTTAALELARDRIERNSSHPVLQEALRTFWFENSGNMFPHLNENYESKNMFLFFSLIKL